MNSLNLLPLKPFELLHPLTKWAHTRTFPLFKQLLLVHCSDLQSS